MPLAAPLRVTVEIRLVEGPNAGERWFRLSEQVRLPAELAFATALPVEGQGKARICFRLPAGTSVEAGAMLHCDPEHPEQGSRAVLGNLAPAMEDAIQSYIEERLRQ